MSYIPKKGEYIWSLIGLLFIILYIPVETAISYPAFSSFYTEAPNTVSMVIDNLLGNNYKQDLLPDLFGYIILIILSFKYDHQTLKKQKESNNQFKYRYIKCCFWMLLASLLNLYCKAIPFLTNGRARYKFSYLFYFVYILIKYISLLEYFRRIITVAEKYENRSYNSVTLIVMMLGLLSGVISDIMRFYEMNILSYIYLLVSIILLIFMTCRIIKNYHPQ